MGFRQQHVIHTSVPRTHILPHTHIKTGIFCMSFTSYLSRVDLFLHQAEREPGRPRSHSYFDCVSAQSAFTLKSKPKFSVVFAHSKGSKKLSLERWTLHTLLQRHIGDRAKVVQWRLHAS